MLHLPFLRIATLDMALGCAGIMSGAFVRLRDSGWATSSLEPGQSPRTSPDVGEAPPWRGTGTGSRTLPLWSTTAHNAGTVLLLALLFGLLARLRAPALPAQETA